LVISQAEVEAGLRRRVEDLDGHVEWGRELVVASQDAHGVSATLADGEAVRAGWLVGCDGAHSRVRELAGVGFPGVPLPERFLLADVHATLPLPRHTVHVWLAGHSVFGSFRCQGTIYGGWWSRRSKKPVTSRRSAPKSAGCSGRAPAIPRRLSAILNGSHRSAFTAGSPTGIESGGSSSPVMRRTSTARLEVKA
jgi:2-polyprenyl-6-methoxyphenol hydroxylase-like FAD-dependent oxidoreductase